MSRLSDCDKMHRGKWSKEVIRKTYIDCYPSVKYQQIVRIVSILQCIDVIWDDVNKIGDNSEVLNKESVVYCKS